MKTTIKLLSLLLVLLTVLQFVPGSVVSAKGVYPTVYSDTYNSGERHELAISLNGTGADAYYEGANEFDVLSTKSSSAILAALRSLMTDTHKKNSTYNNCRDMAVKTDCENEDGRINLLYTSFSSQRSWYTNDIANGWNREHVWPQSLGGYSTSGAGADLHHVRPSDSSINSSRSNKKYGNSPSGTPKYGVGPSAGVLGGYSGTYFEPLDNVKGDVARICLYMYVRYGGESQYNCGNITVVFQSIDVLLEWCALDPVDTWELGRNEVVEAYQGNRNVFIDYPEYAWLIFGREVPADMNTPSGEASDGVIVPNPTDPTTPTEPSTPTDPTEPTEPTEPTVPPAPPTPKEGFTAAMGKLVAGKVRGEDKFNTLCRAVNAYNALSDSEKESVASLYERLRSELIAYNEEIGKVNSDTETETVAIFGAPIPEPQLSVTICYCLLSSKCF